MALSPVSDPSSNTIPTDDLALLEEHYNGRRCILERTAGASGWRRIIPHSPMELHTYLIRGLAELGLIPVDMRTTSYLNIVPIAGWNTQFEKYQWTMYPAVNTLRQYVHLEEEHLIAREAAVSTGQADPGRLAYTESYAMLPRDSTFEFFFREDVPDLAVFRLDDPPAVTGTVCKTYPTTRNAVLATLPTVALIASVNIVVRMRTGVLQSMLRDFSDPVVTARDLGKYLMSLWLATPEDFRQIVQRSRPSDLLEPLPGPPIPTPSSLPLLPTFTSTRDVAENPQPRHEGGPNDHLYFPLTPPSSDADRAARSAENLLLTADAERPMSPKREKSRHTAVPRGPMPGGGTSPFFTSNEWAAVMGNLKLGGPLYDKWDDHFPKLLVCEIDEEDIPEYENDVSWEEMREMMRDVYTHLDIVDQG